MNIDRTRWPDIDWIPEGTRFGASEMVFHRDLPARDLDEVLADVDLIVTGPHASAAFPEEMGPFVDPSFTRRLQRDFTDCSTSPVARRWVQLDPHVLYIEDPHPRAVRDANRPRPADAEATLRAAFDRLRAAGEAKPDLKGVDATRPVTFGLRPVLVEPTDDRGWRALADALSTAGRHGIDAYEALRDELIDRTIECKLRRLAELDPDRVTAAGWRGATTLTVLSLHDTMNVTARADGALANERQPQDRLPAVVALSNCGDGDGWPRAHATGEPLAPDDQLSCSPDALHAMARAVRLGFDAHEPGDVWFNKPYTGGFETRRAGARFREIAPSAFVRSSDGGRIHLELGALQHEYLRELLLGPEAVEHLAQPGSDWPEIPAGHVEQLAASMARAHQLHRRWGTDLCLPPLG